MSTAELIKELRIAAHALELDNPRYPSAYIVSLLDQAADALKTAWIEHQTMLALKQLQRLQGRLYRANGNDLRA
jgi:Fe-S cluster biosynthesis and repair protein YggX